MIGKREGVNGKREPATDRPPLRGSPFSLAP
jgi:hypothetical protein